MSTDLRDGNQSLIEPMSVAKKIKMFQHLVEIGFKEIEVAFPSASETDFAFVRTLIEQNMIPDDVTIEVLMPAREEMIRRSIESLVGVKRAIVHLYNPIAENFRRLVFEADRATIKELALTSTRLIKELTENMPETAWVFQYSPETFSAAEPDFALEVCNAVTAIWQPTVLHKMIINLPATVEMATPNTYADQIEWMGRHLHQRDCIILSVHPHNDRGTAVAAAELAIMAGADRIEGCLFGNGERTGNVDLVTLALNLYSQGIHPGLDFSDIDAVRQVVEYCNQLPVHPRHPYAGDLVFTAFSGSHQDAIKKGLAKQQPDTIWEVPYLPIDPADLQRGYDAVIRVNSQSGKGGVSYILQQEKGLALPRRLQIDFSRVIQRYTDRTGKEATPDMICALFEEHYINKINPFSYIRHRQSELAVFIESRAGESVATTEVMADIVWGQQKCQFIAHGNGPIDAFIRGLQTHLKEPLQLIDYNEHGLGEGASAQAICYMEMRLGKNPPFFGVGIDANSGVAAFKAIVAGLNQFENSNITALESALLA
jgi:2-isopropylmalate synthase